MIPLPGLTTRSPVFVFKNGCLVQDDSASVYLNTSEPEYLWGDGDSGTLLAAGLIELRMIPPGRKKTRWEAGPRAWKTERDRDYIAVVHWQMNLDDPILALLKKFKS